MDNQSDTPPAPHQTHKFDADNIDLAIEQGDTRDERIDGQSTTIDTNTEIPLEVHEQFPRAREHPELFARSVKLLKKIKARYSEDSQVSTMCHNTLGQWINGTISKEEVYNLFKHQLSAHDDLKAEFDQIYHNDASDGHTSVIDPDVDTQSVPLVMEIPHQPSGPLLPSEWRYGQHLPPPTALGTYDEMTIRGRQPDQNIQSPNIMYHENSMSDTFGHQPISNQYHNDYNPFISAPSHAQMFPRAPTTPRLGNPMYGHQVVPSQGYSHQLGSPPLDLRGCVDLSASSTAFTNSHNNSAFTSAYRHTPFLDLQNNTSPGVDNSGPHAPPVAPPLPFLPCYREPLSNESQFATPSARSRKSRSKPTRHDTPEQPKVRRPAGTGDFVHGLCGKHFPSRSAVKKHHFGGKETETPTTGCWFKHKLPARAWNEHPSCQEVDAKSRSSRNWSQSQEPNESTQADAAPVVPNMISSLGDLNPLPNFPTFDHLPQQVYDTVSNSPGFALSSPLMPPRPSQFHDQRLPFTMQYTSGLDTLANAASRINPDVSNDGRQDSVVVVPSGGQGAAVIEEEQANSWANTQQHVPTIDPIHLQHGSTQDDVPVFPWDLITPMQEDQSQPYSEASVIQSVETDHVGGAQQHVGTSNEAPRARESRRGGDRGISKRELKMLGVDVDEEAPDKKKARREKPRKTQ